MSKNVVWYDDGHWRKNDDDNRIIAILCLVRFAWLVEIGTKFLLTLMLTLLKPSFSYDPLLRATSNGCSVTFPQTHKHCSRVYRCMLSLRLHQDESYLLVTLHLMIRGVVHVAAQHQLLNFVKFMDR